MGVRWMGVTAILYFSGKLEEDGSVRRGVVMVNQPGLFSPKFGATRSHVFTQSPQNIAVEPRIHSLVCWDRCFALPQLHQSGIFWIPLRIGPVFLGCLILEDGTDRVSRNIDI
jgi:hypothetical protein